jgi:L-lactate utilization protein LutB
MEEMGMDKSMQAIMRKRVDRTVKSLIRNRFDAQYVDTAKEAVQLVSSMLQPGMTVAFGGSMTLQEAGVMDMLKQAPVNLVDRNQPGLSQEDIKACYRQAFSSDVYLCSTNAVTEQGELYNVDGNSNRVSAMLFGPDKVIVVAGVNKIVTDLAEADRRMKTVAAPANATRLSCATPCVQTGRCEDCQSPARICCNTVVMGPQRHQGRVTVLIVGETLGY